MSVSMIPKILVAGAFTSYHNSGIRGRYYHGHFYRPCHCRSHFFRNVAAITSAFTFDSFVPLLFMRAPHKCSYCRRFEMRKKYLEPDLKVMRVFITRLQEDACDPKKSPSTPRTDISEQIEGKETKREESASAPQVKITAGGMTADEAEGIKETRIDRISSASDEEEVLSDVREMSVTSPGSITHEADKPLISQKDRV